MTQEKQGERAKWLSFLSKAAIVAVILVAIGCVCIGGICLVFWKATHRQETEGARMRRLVEQLGARETEIALLPHMILYRTHRHDEAKRKLRAEGKRAVPFLIEGLHHEHWLVRMDCTGLLFVTPTKEGTATLIRCLGEGEKPVPSPSDVHTYLEGITGYSGGLDRENFDDERDKEKTRQVWQQWWEDYKDSLVETPSGLGIRRPDGTVMPLPAEWGPDPPACMASERLAAGCHWLLAASASGTTADKPPVAPGVGARHVVPLQQRPFSEGPQAG